MMQYSDVRVTIIILLRMYNWNGIKKYEQENRAIYELLFLDTEGGGSGLLGHQGIYFLCVKLINKIVGYHASLQETTVVQIPNYKWVE